MANRLSKHQLRMRKIVADYQKYVSTYTKQLGYDSYSDRVLIDDLLYGIGIALDPDEYSFSPGFDKFKAKLREHLGCSPETVKSPHE